MLIDSFDGKRLNSPNDVVVKSDGSIWFTDPVFGLLGNYEGYVAESEIDANVYRIDGETGKASIVAEGVLGPNGLCFSPDEKILYLVESRGVPNRKILAYDVSPSGVPGPASIRTRLLVILSPEGETSKLRILRFGTPRDSTM